MDMTNQQQPPMPQQAAQAPMPTKGKGPKVNPKQLTKDQERDLHIAVLLGERLLRGGGFDVIEKAWRKSSQPAHVIGQFLMHLGQQMMESMPHNIILSPRILLCHGGWLEQMSDLIQKVLHVPKKIMDQAEIFVASTATHMAQTKQQQSGGAINGIQAPPVPSPNAPQAPPIPQPAQGGQ